MNLESSLGLGSSSSLAPQSVLSIQRRIGSTCLSYEQRSGTINQKEERAFHQRRIFLTLLEWINNDTLISKSEPQPLKMVLVCGRPMHEVRLPEKEKQAHEVRLPEKEKQALCSETPIKRKKTRRPLTLTTQHPHHYLRNDSITSGPSLKP